MTHLRLATILIIISTIYITTSAQDIELPGALIFSKYSVKAKQDSFGIFDGSSPKLVVGNDDVVSISDRLNMRSSTHIYQLSAEGQTFTLRQDGDYLFGFYGPDEWGPTVNNTIDLGSPLYRWRKLYASSALITGELSTLSLKINNATFPPSGASTGDVLTYNSGALEWGSGDWSNNGGKIYYDNGNVGIGSPDPLASLEIKSTSSSALPHISLIEEGATSFARIKMRNLISDNNHWTIAAQVAENGAQEDAVINFFYNDGTFNVFKFFGNGDATFKGNIVANGMSYPSDIKLKRNINLISNHQDLYQLNGYTYYWKTERDMENNDLEHGVIAQEVQALYPSLVKESRDGHLSVNYNGLIPIMIEGLKAQKVELDQSISDINKLKLELEKMKDQIQFLMNK